MDSQQQPQERSAERLVAWSVVCLALFSIAVYIGYRYDITLWDWLKLLVVPAVIAGGGIWFNRQQRERELEIARQQRERELDIADRRSQDEALQAYLDQIGTLLLDKERPLRQSKEGDEDRTLARARTLTVLRRLDDERKGRVLQFLYESGLIFRIRGVLDLQGADLSDAELREANLEAADLHAVDLSGANLQALLRDADLERANLRGTDLTGAYLYQALLYGANLREANLSGADLSRAQLINANLSNADLSRARMGSANLQGIRLIKSDLRNAKLGKADLSQATMTGADLSDANLSEAVLSQAYLNDTNLNRANLSDTNLNKANLSGARGITNEELEQQSASLVGTTMPNGQKYEDWLKDRESGK